MLFIRYNVMTLIILAPFFLSTKPVFAKAQAVDYLCEIGKSYYSLGRVDDALHEFNKALLLDPANKIAKEYVTKIFTENSSVEPVPTITKKSSLKTAPITQKPTVKSIRELSDKSLGIQSIKPELSREGAMNLALNDLKGSKEIKPAAFIDVNNPIDENDVRGRLRFGLLRISGEMQVSFGITPNDFIWKRANYDMNERNWRLLSTDAYNNRFNTFDTRVYDNLSVNLDTENKTGFNFHSNITVDPWSFTGKSNKFTITGAGLPPDSAEIELRYWSNTGYTRNDTVYTLAKGDTFNLPEIKVVNGRILPMTITSSYSNTFSIPETKIQRTFQPVRELWFDYLNEEAAVKFRVFPIAYQNQALLSDDPLQITNHHTWWAASPWLKKYSPGNYNSTATPISFRKGKWDDTYATDRDSTGRYLTSLRGFSFTLGSQDATSFDTTVASPKDLWQDYDQVDNYITASRLKHKVLDNLSIGATFTSRTGLQVNDKNKTDSLNYVGGGDLSYEVIPGLKAQAEILASQSYYDQTNSQYKTEARGNAYYFTIINRYPQKDIISLADTYNQIRLEKDEPFLVKTRFFLARMDEGFDASLSEYRDTRDDSFWSRHISFRKSFGYTSPGLGSNYANEDALKATRIGDGIDAGRSSIGFRNEVSYEDTFSNLFDVRNVHRANGKYVETVFRDEIMYKPAEKLTLKGLLLYQNLPHTVGGIDPFDIDPDTDNGIANAAVPDGADPSIKTGSLGLEYAFEEWISANLTWERTNDYYLAYGNFPNGLLNSANLSRIYYENGKTYAGWNRWLYSQGIFEQAPYPFYNIYKAGIDLLPMDKMNIYLDYTYNDFMMAGQNSDNMNHLGLQFVYEPTDKLGFSLKYTYSRWKDPVLVNAGNTETIGHHNFFAEFRYLASKDSEFNLQYGEGNSSAIGRLYDPTGGSLLTIDTAHIIRAYYRRKF